MSECTNCKGKLWVCENHPYLAWPSECDCGAGMPCECNPEAVHLNSTVIQDVDGVDVDGMLKTLAALESDLARCQADLRQSKSDLERCREALEKLEGYERTFHPKEWVSEIAREALRLLRGGR